MSLSMKPPFNAPKQPKRIAAEQCGVVASAEGHHGFRPVHHWCEEELKLVLSNLNGVAILHLNGVLLDAIESRHHVEASFVANDLNVGIVFL